jgi:hypothetical protein
MKLTKTIKYGWDSDARFFIEETIRNTETDEIISRGTCRINMSYDAAVCVQSAISERYSGFPQVGQYTEVL